MQNLVAVSLAVCVCIGGPKNLGTLGVHSPNLGRGWPLEKRSFPTCVTVLNVVTLGQTVWVSVWVPQNLGTLSPAP